MFSTIQPIVATKSSLERATRIELAFSAWEAEGHSARTSEKVLFRGKKSQQIARPCRRWASNGRYDQTPQDSDSGAQYPQREVP